MTISRVSSIHRTIPSAWERRSAERVGSSTDSRTRLTGVEAFRENMLRSIAANGPFNRVRYTLSKIRDKLLDKEAYGSQG